MIDLKEFRKNPDFFVEAAKNKNVTLDTKKILKLDGEILVLKKEIDEINAKRNIIAKKGKEGVEEGRVLKDKLKDLEPKLIDKEKKLNELLLDIPNPARPDVKIGKGEEENEEVRKVGEPTQFDFIPKDYLTLGEDLNLIDVKRAGKVSGSRFGYLKGDLARLQFALINYALEILSKEGFIPVIPPVLIKTGAMQAMGYLQHGGADEVYAFPKDDLVLVGTSEQSIGPYHMDEVLNTSDLPLRYVGYSTCFRREAGSYGKDTKGILRVHQFDKLEMFSFCHPSKSEAEHKILVGIEEKILQGLKLPYRVMKMCTGDLGDVSARRYDIETWLPSEGKYRETHSCSQVWDFQSRRLNIKYKDADTGKNEYIHLLNGTAVALGRMLIMILENYQQADGSVAIPEVLQKYLGKKFITNKKD